MRSKRVRLILLSLLGLALTAPLITLNEREPVRNGKPLADWLVLLQGGTPQEKQRALEAVQGIGSNALPCLLRWLDYKPAPFREKVFLLFKDRLPFQIVSSRPFQSLSPRSAMQKQLDAMAGFWAIEEKASSAATDLERILNESYFAGKSELAALALVAIGEAGVPPLERALLNEQRPKPDIVADSIRWGNFYGKDVTVFVPTLIRCMQQTNFYFVAEAAKTLGSTHSRPDLSVPALVVGLQHPDPSVRYECATALGRFRREALNACAALDKARVDKDAQVGQAADLAIHYIQTGEDPEIFLAVP
jgi:hypothetical protein